MSFTTALRECAPPHWADRILPYEGSFKGSIRVTSKGGLHKGYDKGSIKGV